MPVDAVHAGTKALCVFKCMLCRDSLSFCFRADNVGGRFLTPLACANPTSTSHDLPSQVPGRHDRQSPSSFPITIAISELQVDHVHQITLPLATQTAAASGSIQSSFCKQR